MYEANGLYQIVRGSEAALLAAGYTDPDYFAPKPKRKNWIELAGNCISTERLKGGCCEIFMTVGFDRSRPPDGAYAGRTPVAWAECAWRPDDVDA